VSESEAATLMVPYRTASGKPWIPNGIAEKLIENWRTFERHKQAVADGEAKSADCPIEMPLVKLFRPGGRYRCLISRMNPIDVNMAYGLTDTGTGLPEMGLVRLDVISSWRTAMGPAIERDELFNPKRSLFLYWEAWRDEALLRKASDQLNDAGALRHRQIMPMPQSFRRSASQGSGGSRARLLGGDGGGPLAAIQVIEGELRNPC
jgi:Protein of unknown function (DUF2958)